MILHFLRHAQAEVFNPQIHSHDSDRALTPEGRKMLHLAAQEFLKAGIQFDSVISSPYCRAVESAKIVTDVFQFKKQVNLSEHLTPEASIQKFREELLNKWSGLHAILFITHQPFVSACISDLLNKKKNFIGQDMGTGSLCTFEVDPSFKCQQDLVNKT